MFEETRLKISGTQFDREFILAHECVSLSSCHHSPLHKGEEDRQEVLSRMKCDIDSIARTEQISLYAKTLGRQSSLSRGVWPIRPNSKEWW